MTIAEVILFSVVVIGAFQLFVTLRLLRSRAYTAKQKVLQTLLVWLVPVLGAILVNAFMESDAVKSLPIDTRFTPEYGGNPGGMGPDNGDC